MRRISSLSLMALILILSMVLLNPAFAQKQAIEREDYKSLCEEGYKNAKGTKDIVAGVIAKVEKEIGPETSAMKKDEVDDAKMWFNKGDKLLTESKAKMDKGQYTKDLSIDLNQSWQWFIKSGSAIVRASMQE